MKYLPLNPNFDSSYKTLATPCSGTVDSQGSRARPRLWFGLLAAHGLCRTPCSFEEAPKEEIVHCCVDCGLLHLLYFIIIACQGGATLEIPGNHLAAHKHGASCYAFRARTKPSANTPIICRIHGPQSTHIERNTSKSNR